MQLAYPFYIGKFPAGVPTSMLTVRVINGCVYSGRADECQITNEGLFMTSHPKSVKSNHVGIQTITFCACSLILKMEVAHLTEDLKVFVPPQIMSICVGWFNKF